MLLNSVMKFKYFPPNIHHFCFLIVSYVMLPTNSIFALLVAKIGMPILMQTSVGNWFFGDGNFTGLPSKRSSKSFQQINWLLHLKFCKTMTSALSAPTQAYLSFAGLLNTWWMISTSFNMKLLPQFAGSIIMTFLNLTRPCISRSLMASA